MASSVLILDDDADFNSLLADIFEQADYDVTSFEDPEEALQRFGEGGFDLVVTDQKMPKMTGAEFMAKVKEMRPETPVIMVSGYMENDIVRDLIRDGVGGVFLKPLNIFSLLERTKELIDESRKAEDRAARDAEAGAAAENEAEQLGFPFRSFPGKASASLNFAERLHGLRNFKTALLLIGEPGTHFRGICEDLRGFRENRADTFVYVTSGDSVEERLRSEIDRARRDEVQRVTCVALDFEAMGAEQKAALARLSWKEGAFEGRDVQTRIVFCVNSDLDTLYDRETIDERLYILMGTAEVQVPPLRDCVEDIPILARQLVAQTAHARGEDVTARFDRSAIDLLKEHSWERNYEELAEVAAALARQSPVDVITASELRPMLRGAARAEPAEALRAELSRSREEFVQGANFLLGGDVGRTAAFLGLEDAATLDVHLRASGAESAMNGRD